MKKIGILIFAAALVIGLVVANMFSFGHTSGKVFNFSMNFGGVHGSGNVVSEKRDLSGFKAVDVSGVFQVEIVAQKEFSVEVVSDDNILPLISTSVDDGTLRIECEKRIKSASPVIVRISAPDIDNLQVSGAANVTLSGVKNPNLGINSSGAAKVTVSGETAKFAIDVSGATKIFANDLKAVDANIDGSGASYIETSVTGELRSDLSGASRVVYSGSPSNVVTETSGASRVSQKQ